MSIDTLLIRFVEAHERIATALEALGRTPATEAAPQSARAPEPRQSVPEPVQAPTPIPTPTPTPADGVIAPRPRGRPRKNPEPAPHPAMFEGDVVETPVVEAEPVTVTVVEATPAVTAPACTLDVMRASVAALASDSSEGRAEAVNILTKYGCKRASDAKPSDYGAIKAEMDAALATLKG